MYFIISSATLNDFDVKFIKHLKMCAYASHPPCNKWIQNTSDDRPVHVGQKQQNDQVNYLHTLLKQLKYRFPSFYTSSSHHDKAQITLKLLVEESRIIWLSLSHLSTRQLLPCCFKSILVVVVVQCCVSNSCWKTVLLFFFHYLLSGCITQDSKLNMGRYIFCDPLKLYESGHCWCQHIFSHILFSASWEVASCWKVPTTWPGKSVWLQLCSFLQ